MPNLVDAFDKATFVLKQAMAGGKQRGGECGLYSLWYASLLLSFIKSDDRKIVYPRKSYAPDQPGSRSFAKQAFGFGQGEIELEGNARSRHPFRLSVWCIAKLGCYEAC
jgi:hypothetical protein